MSEKAVIIELRDVSLSFGNNLVFGNISYAFPDKQVTGILGPSGAGKSTLLRTLNRMNDEIESFAVRGTVRVQGREIYGNGIDLYHLRQRVGMVFQKPCVFPRSIYENVLLGLRKIAPRRKKEFPAIMEQTLRQVFLWDEVKDRLKQSATDLSQGQQQRLSIARALALQPDVLLMDEPTSSLDPKSTRAIEDLIHSQKGKRAVILVTHNLEQARRVSDEAMFVCEGGICESGSTENLFDKPCREKTAEYLNHGS